MSGPAWLTIGWSLFIASGVIWVAALIPIEVMQARLASGFRDAPTIPDRYKELEILVLRDETLLRWLRRLVARRWRYAHRAPGRPPLESSLRRTTLVLSGRHSDAVGARVEALLVS